MRERTSMCESDDDNSRLFCRDDWWGAVHSPTNLVTSRFLLILCKRNSQRPTDPPLVCMKQDVGQNNFPCRSRMRENLASERGYCAGFRALVKFFLAQQKHKVQRKRCGSILGRKREYTTRRALRLCLVSNVSG